MNQAKAELFLCKPFLVSSSLAGWRFQSRNYIVLVNESHILSGELERLSDLPFLLHGEDTRFKVMVSGLI